MIDVMIIDDEVWVIEVIKNLIDWKAMGFNIISTVDNGKKAYDLINEKKPKLVLTDIRMPGLDGLELIKRIKNNKHDILFIIISGYNDFEYAKTALTYGAIGYLLKPIDKSELENTVKHAKEIIERNEVKQESLDKIIDALENKVDKLKEQYFLSEMKGESEDRWSYDKVNAEFGLKFTNALYRVSIFAFNNFNSYENIIEKCYQIMWEMSFPVINKEIITLRDENNLILLMNYSEKEKSRIRYLLDKILYQLKLSNTEFGHITLANGREVNAIEDIRQSYDVAKNLLGTRIILGTGRNYYEEDIIIKTVVSTGIINPEFETYLKQAIELLDYDNIIHATKKILDQLANDSSENPYLMMKGIRKIVDIYEAYTISGSERLNRAYFTQIRDSIENCITIQEVLRILNNIVEDLINLNLKTEVSKNEKIINSVKKYIDRNYNREISLSEISEIVHLNANYFSELFKKETGTTFKEYHSLRKIEAAKEFLKDYTMRINEICEKVGYNDVKHFSRQFKKYVGVNPTDYRRLFLR